MKRVPLWNLLAVAILAILVYANSLSGAFVWDDETQIVKNENLRSLSNLPAAFTQPFWGFATANAANRSNYYRPLQTVGYILAYAWGELSPTPYHALNVAMHVIASLFVYLICAELGFSGLLPLLGAALFAAHPIHTEAVAWIAGLPDAACGALYFASLWAFLRSKSGSSRGWLAISVTAFLLALFAKEMAITLPALVMLYMVWRREWNTVALIPYATAASLYLALRVNALGFLATEHTRIEASVLDWITLGIRVLGQYIWQALLPYPLVAYQLIEIHTSDRVIPTLAALALACTLAVVAWRYRRQVPEGWFWCAAFVLMLAPVFYFKGISNVVLAERYLYIPSLAAVVLAVSLAARSKYALWLAWAAVVLFAGLTIARNQDWQDRERLFSKTVEQEPESAHMRVNLAELLLNRGDDGNASRHLTAALESLNSGKYSQVPYDVYRARIGLGAILARGQRYKEAREHLEAARNIYPQGEWSYLYLGGIAMQAENNDAVAVELLRKAASLGPLNEVARDYLGVALFNQGKLAEAKAAFEEALRINPTHRDARQHLEMVTGALAQPAP